VKFNTGSIFLNDSKIHTLKFSDYSISNSFTDGLKLAQYLTRTGTIEFPDNSKYYNVFRPDDHVLIWNVGIIDGNADNIKDLNAICWNNDVELNAKYENPFRSLCSSLSVSTTKKYLALIHTMHSGFNIIHFDNLEFLEGILTYSSWNASSYIKSLSEGKISITVFKNFITVPLTIKFNLAGMSELIDVKMLKTHLQIVIDVSDLNQIVIDYLTSRCENDYGNIKCTTLFDPENNVVKSGIYLTTNNGTTSVVCPGCWGEKTDLEPFVCKLV